MSVCPSVGWLVGRSITLELKSGKTRISTPAHPSATDGRVSGLVMNIVSMDSVGKSQPITTFMGSPSKRVFIIVIIVIVLCFVNSFIHSLKYFSAPCSSAYSGSLFDSFFFF